MQSYLIFRGVLNTLLVVAGQPPPLTALTSVYSIPTTKLPCIFLSFQPSTVIRGKVNQRSTFQVFLVNSIQNLPCKHRNICALKKKKKCSSHNMDFSLLLANIKTCRSTQCLKEELCSTEIHRCHFTVYIKAHKKRHSLNPSCKNYTRSLWPLL